MLVTPKVAVITVLSGQNSDFMSKCLMSLLENTAYPDVQFIIVCDSGDSLREMITNTSRNHPSITPVWRGQKYGCASNKNYGATFASRRPAYLLFTDSDVMYTDKLWLNKLVEFAEENPKVGLVGSGNETTLGHFCWVQNETGVLINDVMDFAGAVPSTPLEFMVIKGYNQLIREPLFHSIGGWDEGFFPIYGEDIDLCVRCILAGYGVYGVFNPGVNHLYRDTNENNSCERLSSEDRLWLTVASCRRLAIKFDGILPCSDDKTYRLWIDCLDKLRDNASKKKLILPSLPPTVVNGKIFTGFLPLNADPKLAKIIEELCFNQWMGAPLMNVLTSSRS
jgi:GT2 family glycosyltransferase